jgi:hypothetical protein
MASFKERGDETNVGYEIATTPSAVRFMDCICLVRVVRVIVRKNSWLAIALVFMVTLREKRKQVSRDVKGRKFRTLVVQGTSWDCHYQEVSIMTTRNNTGFPVTMHYPDAKGCPGYHRSVPCLHPCEKTMSNDKIVTSIGGVQYNTQYEVVKTGTEPESLKKTNKLRIHCQSSPSVSFKSTCDSALRSAAPVSSIECKKRSN